MMLPSFTLNDIRLLPIQKCGVLPDCHGLDAHLVTVENFHNCSGGGTTALHAYRVWGAVIFGDEIGCVWLAVTTRRPNGSTSEIKSAPRLFLRGKGKCYNCVKTPRVAVLIFSTFPASPKIF